MLLMMNLDSTVLGCGGNYGSVGRAKRQVGNAQNLRRIKQRKGDCFTHQINTDTWNQQYD